MSMFLIAGLVALYLFHAVVIQPWVTTVVLNSFRWVEKKVQS